MTSTYTTSGTLTNPVNDLDSARAYLAEDDMTQYAPAGLPIHDVRWDLLDEGSWKVTVVTDRELTEAESAEISEWISGQNSDGLGEGFEQQPFAEHCEYDRWGNMDEDSYVMSSFDWETNDCTLVFVK